jgi:hypothetical protein
MNALRHFVEDHIDGLLIEILNTTELPISESEYVDRYLADLHCVAEIHGAESVVQDHGMLVLLSCEATMILDHANTLDHLIADILRVNAEFGIHNKCVTASLVFKDIRSYIARARTLE